MLYLPTSDAIKFKAKGWIDVFGSRCAKGVGSFVTLSSRGDRRRLATYGGVASFLIRFVSCLSHFCAVGRLPTLPVHMLVCVCARFVCLMARFSLCVARWTSRPVQWRDRCFMSYFSF